MNAESHGEHLVKLTRLRFVNCYLVREDDGFTLVDTGLKGSAKDILAAAAEAGAAIARIALTHGHGDHVGSLDALAQRVPAAEVIASAREARFLRGDKSLDRDEPQKKALGMEKVKTPVAREVVPGDRVGSLEVVAAPGHSPGQIAFLDTRDRTLIAGDSWATLGGVSVSSRVNPRCPAPGIFTWHRPTALASGRALRALEPARLAPGHGSVLERPLAKMDRALAEAS